MTTLTDLSKSLNLMSNHRIGPSLIMITDQQRLPDPDSAAQRLPRGAAVLLRDYDAPDRHEIGVRLAKICRRKGLSLIVAGDIDLANQLGADGLHLPEWSVRRNARRALTWRAARQARYISAAAHSPAALRRAARIGADLALLSPVFATASHPGASEIGVLRFTEWCRNSSLAVFALGGIDTMSARRLRRSGAEGIAGINIFSANVNDRKPGWS